MSTLTAEKQSLLLNARETLETATARYFSAYLVAHPEEEVRANAPAAKVKATIADLQSGSVFTAAPAGGHAADHVLTDC